MTFGPGLHGHDIGGFAGKHHPSPELLVCWCQNGAWHSRFTVHSWKEISTTMWMYKEVPGITEILKDVLNFHYQLTPTFYSLYVTHDHRQGHPLLKIPSSVLALADSRCSGTIQMMSILFAWTKCSSSVLTSLWHQ